MKSKKTWRDLKAEGKLRCCAYYVNRATGKSRRCRREAAANKSWCGMCAKKIEPIIEQANENL